MPGWKKRIFTRAIKSRMVSEQQDRDIIISYYPALMDEEKTELTSEIPATWQEVEAG